MLKFKMTTKYNVQLFRVVGKGDDATYSFMGTRNAPYDSFTTAKSAANYIAFNINFRHKIIGEWSIPTDDFGFALTSEDFYRYEDAIVIFCDLKSVHYAVRIVPFVCFE